MKLYRSWLRRGALFLIDNSSVRILGLAALLLIALYCARSVRAYHRSHTPVPLSQARSGDSSTRIKQLDVDDTEGIQLTVSAVGDCVLGADPRFIHALSFDHYRHDLRKPDDYFLSGVRDVLAHDDLTIANAECVLASPIPAVHKPAQRGGRFWFRGDPGNARIFSAGSVDAVNLANNHSFDYGSKGMRETVASLEKAGIKPFGGDVAQIAVVKGVSVGLLGYCVMGPLEQGVDEGALRSRIARDIDAMRRRCDLCIVTFHWGNENSYSPTSQQIRLGHFAVDHGADLVLGHHPHILQPVETYHGVEIVYSLGNFVYGGSAQVRDRNTMIFQETFLFGRGGEGRISNGADAARSFVCVGSHAREVPCFVYDTPLNDYRPVIAGAPIKISDHPCPKLPGMAAGRIRSANGSGLQIRGENVPHTWFQPKTRLSEAANAPASGRPAAETVLPERLPDDFVRLDTYVPSVVVDLRYATDVNPYRHRFYRGVYAYLRRDVAVRLTKASELAAGYGVKLKVWDAYRPRSVQRRLQVYIQDPQWIAQGISNHNRGAAVDVTLTDRLGNELDMGTGFDSFSAQAHVDAAGISREVVERRKLLRSVMMRAGFRPIGSEWWHFDATDAHDYPAVDVAI